MRLISLLAIALLCVAAGPLAQAKLPPPSDEAKAKAAEAAAKSAWSGKVANYQLCKSQDRAAAAYQAVMKQAGKEPMAAVATPPCADPGPFAPPSDAAATPAAPAAPATAAPAAPATAAAAPKKS